MTVKKVRVRPMARREAGMVNDSWSSWVKNSLPDFNFKDCPAFINEPKYKTGQSLNKVL